MATKMMIYSHLLFFLLVSFDHLILHAAAARPSVLERGLKEGGDPAVAESAAGLLTRQRYREELFHPATGLCVVRRHLTDPLRLGPCAQSDSWSYTPQKFLTVKGTYFCLKATGVGKPAKLSIFCYEEDSQWAVETRSEHRSHLATALPGGRGQVCLDVDSDGVVVTNRCADYAAATGASDDVGDTQWFELLKKDYAAAEAEAAAVKKEDDGDVELLLQDLEFN